MIILPINVIVDGMVIDDRVVAVCASEDVPTFMTNI